MSLHPGQPFLARIGKHKALPGVVVWHFAASKPRYETYTVRIRGLWRPHVFYAREIRPV